MEHRYEVAVLGGGPGGYTAALKAAQAGKRTCLVEEGALGGVCLNEGCIPTKTFLKSVEVLEAVERAQAFGVCGLGFETPSLDMELLQARKSKVVSQLRSGIAFLLKSAGVEVIRGRGAFLDGGTLQAGELRLQSQDFILATGSEPVLPPIEVSEGGRLLTSSEVLSLEALPSTAAVIGGGVVGIELAYFLASAGVKVTVLELLERILPTVDEEIAGLAKKSLEKKGIRILTGVRVEGIDGTRLTYRQGEQTEEVEASLTLAAAGRRPRTKGLGLERLGLLSDRGAVTADEGMRSSHPHIYAVGDVNGRSMLAHTAMKEAEVAVDRILGRETAMDYSAIPICVFIQPEIGCVGLSEEEARRAYPQVVVGRSPLSRSGKALVEGRTEGVFKVVGNGADGRILGAHFLGLQAANLISEVTVAMKNGVTLDRLADAVHPHPTLSEAVCEAFQDASSQASRR